MKKYSSSVRENKTLCVWEKSEKEKIISHTAHGGESLPRGIAAASGK